MDRKLMCQVNLADDLAFKENLGLLEDHRAGYYTDAFSDRKRMGSNVYRFQERYYDNARFVIYAGLPCSQKLSRCGMTVNRRPAYCKNRKFCTCCAYKFGTNVFERVQDCFLGRTAYFVTLGYSGTGGLPWEHRDDCDVYWEAGAHAIDKALNTGAGAIVTRELHLRSMRPLTLNPHTHAILSFEGFTDAFELQQKLQDEMTAYLGKQIGFVSRLTPDVQVRLIEDTEDFEHTIRYQFKPIELKAIYESAIVVRGDAPEAMTTLNSEMTDFLRWFGHKNTMKKQLRMKGVFNPNSRQFVGQKLKDLKKDRRKAAQATVLRAIRNNARFLATPAPARDSRTAKAEFAEI